LGKPEPDLRECGAISRVLAACRSVVTHTGFDLTVSTGAV